MRGSIEDIQPEIESPELVVRTGQWGGMDVEMGEMAVRFETADLFKGAPDDMCQCPHWGFVIRGQIHCEYADHEETYNAGDMYYMPPGHLTVYEPGTLYVEFSPSDEHAKMMAVVEKNWGAEEGGD